MKHLHRVTRYEDVFTIDDNRIISMIKIRVVQAMIQVTRPTAWLMSRVKGKAMELKCIELYNATIKGAKDSCKLSWEPIKQGPGHVDKPSKEILSY